MISVLHLVPTLTTSDGISSATSWMLDVGLERGDWRPLLITARFRGVPLREEMLRRLGASAQVLDVPTAFPARIGQAIGPPRFASILQRSLSSSTMVHIHGLWRFPSFRGGPIVRRLRVPYVVSPHGLLMPGPLRRGSFKKRIALRLVELANLRFADAIVVSSRLEREGVERIAPSLADRIVEISPGLDGRAADFFQREARPTGSDRRTILCVARLHPIKGLHHLVEAFERIAGAYGAWDLLIVGPLEDLAYVRQLNEIVLQAGLTSRVTLVGTLSDEALWRTYLRADVFVLPSTSENFGLAVLEALAAGVPVITTKGTIWNELESEGCGWWVDPDADHLGKALTQALALSDASRREMGARGAALAAKRYSQEQLGSRLSDLYRRLGAARGLS